MNNFSLAIHGGAGTILKSSMDEQKESGYRNALLNALGAGRSVLQNGGSAIDAVTAAVVSLEDCPLFNAGKGSVFTHEGMHEMDAAVMDGNTRSAGAVAGIRSVKNPVLLAREIMIHSGHVFLAGMGAEDFARNRGLTFEDDSYFHDDFRYQQFQEALQAGKVTLDHTDRKFGTVGAVARDVSGNLAAATSTGGMTNKRYGRVGDTPVIGAGTYASNSTCAISCTGHGEYFLRAVVAYDVSCLMEYKGLSLKEACHKVILEKLAGAGGDGGLIGLDTAGNTMLVFNTEGMYRAWISEANEDCVAIY